MNALQIPLGIKDVIIGAETIQAARSKSGTAGFYSPQPAPAAAPTIAAPAAGGPFCSKCGAKNDAGARFCNKCGAAMG
ncbi:MAG: zinc ribbon domain-containing protein [Candidatus Lokiarchaeota archaeon]|nr:zinc ribbon domain-containing protein [Candidatus Lokiarchaeota archaeon]